MTTDIDWAILDRYFSGGCAADEVAAVRRWVDHDPANAETLASVKRIWEEAGIVPQRFDSEAALRAMYARVEAPTPLHLPTRAPRLHAMPSIAPRHRRAWRWGAAAAVAAAIVAGVALVGTARDAPPVIDRTPLPGRVYATTTGQRADLLLPDGTRVSLNVASELRVPSAYGVGARDVYLSGEAYFDVRHDARRPFRVHTQDAVAEDLGTAFVVRAYEVDSASTVVVASGRVALRGGAPDAGHGVSLTAGQLGRLDATGMAVVVPAVNVGDYLAWRAGALVFRDTPLAEAARELGRWYGVDVTITDSVMARGPVNGAFVDQPLDVVLGILAPSLDARITRQANHVRISPTTAATRR
jgi:transmembrane sensor